MKTLRGQRPSYKTVKLLGEGLTGKVYKAFRWESQYGTHQVVAVKLLKSKNQVSILRNEFSRLQKIESNHCVKLLGWENLQMGPALILEYLEGLNLWELLHLQDFSPRLIREIVAQAQAGLRDLEVQGLYHGDLSLKNIFVTTRGLIKLIDFGCGGVESGLLGNPNFMAPELGETQQPSLKSDLFSLGMIELHLAQKNFMSLFPKDHCDESVLLSRDPLCRKFQPYRSTFKVRARLGARVRQSLKVKNESQNTKLLSKSETIPKPSLQKKIIVAAATFAFIMGIPLYPSRPIAYSALDTGSWRFAGIALNAVPLQKSSIYIDKIRPGTYRWRWPSKLGGGESRIRFVENEIYRFSGGRR